jgi:hypothetical protein
VPFGTQGTVFFEAFAFNRFLAANSPDSATALIIRQDTIRPGVTLPQITLPARVERQDTLRISVQAQDDQFGSGLARVGVVITDEDFPADGSITVDTTFATAPTGSTTVQFRIPVNALPGPASNTARVRNLRVVAFAIDRATPNALCTAVGATGTTVTCTLAGNSVNVAGLPGASASTEVVATRSSSNAVTPSHVLILLCISPRLSNKTQLLCYRTHHHFLGPCNGTNTSWSLPIRAW